MLPFTTSNYGITTCSATEWWFVAEPEAGLAALGLGEWPREAVLLADPELHGKCRTPLPLGQLEGARQQMNQRLEAMGVGEPVSRLDTLACRLYTGPRSRGTTPRTHPAAPRPNPRP